jgi:hypothetical protein
MSTDLIDETQEAMTMLKSYDGPESGAALFEHSCGEWLARCVRLADAKDAAREPSAEHWTEWFAEAIRRRTAREMALVKKVQL